jgi:hypothetical protein
MLDGLSDAEWRELTDLVFTCADDRLASVVCDLAGYARSATTAGRAASSAPVRAPGQEGVVTSRVLASGRFYRALLRELRRRAIH